MIENTTVHEEGPPWEVTGRFATFEEADSRRQELLNEDDLQVKVQWMRKREDFAVKTRRDPTAAVAAAKKEEKLRRKKKLSKKRRKK